MNKTNTTESTLNMIKSMCAERDRKERNRLSSNRHKMDRREESEKERLQHTNSILNSYIEKAKARENQQAQEHNQSIQNMRDESNRKMAEDAYRSEKIVSAIRRGIRNAMENERRKTGSF